MALLQNKLMTLPAGMYVFLPGIVITEVRAVDS